MAEHSRIARYFAPLTANEPGAFGLTDDAALLTPPVGQQLILTTDSVIEGIHVLPRATPAQFARKLVRRNLSDLAAMGATPWRYLLNLHTPHNLPEAWYAEFAATLAEEQRQFGMVLIGGDSSSGGALVHTTLTCFGLTDAPPLRRNGAAVGDAIYISGTVGDAALGLKMLQQSVQQTPAHYPHAIAHYHRPKPRLALGAALRGIASAALDISDGLLADLGQLCTASQVGASIDQSAIPCSDEVAHYLAHHPQAWAPIISGGDDYELCFTAPRTAATQIETLAKKLGLRITRIGEITSGNAVLVRDNAGQPIPLAHRGWEHA